MTKRKSFADLCIEANFNDNMHDIDKSANLLNNITSYTNPNNTDSSRTSNKVSGTNHSKKPDKDSGNNSDTNPSSNSNKNSGTYSNTNHNKSSNKNSNRNSGNNSGRSSNKNSGKNSGRSSNKNSNRNSDNNSGRSSNKNSGNNPGRISGNDSNIDSNTNYNKSSNTNSNKSYCTYSGKNNSTNSNTNHNTNTGINPNSNSYTSQSTNNNKYNLLNKIILSPQYQKIYNYLLKQKNNFTSARQIEFDTGISTNTIYKGLQRLKKLGLISYKKENGALKGIVFEILHEVKVPRIETVRKSTKQRFQINLSPETVIFLKKEKNKGESFSDLIERLILSKNKKTLVN